VALPFLMVAAQAQAEACWEKVRAQLETAAPVNTAEVTALDNDAKTCFAQVLSDPATLNHALQSVTAVDFGWAFLRDVHWAFKTFESPDATGSSRAHLGISYAYDKSIVTAPLAQTCGVACMTALDFRFSTQGNVAFDSDVNPRDFLESHLTFAWFRSSGGARQLTPTAQDQYNDLAIKMAMVPAGREAELQQYYKQLSRLIAGNLTDQIYLEFGGDVSLESDQKFSRKQMVYAARAAIDFRGWSGLNATSWQATPTSGKLNIFDYPFALLRRLTGYGPCDAGGHALGSCIAPLATSWPTVSVAIGQVQASQNDPRTLLANGDASYTRIATEISFKTPVAMWGEKPIYVTANYRRYDELSAPIAVKQANLGSFRYLAAIVGPQRGFFASYSTGRLPFDRRSDQIYELGFRTALN